MSTLPDGYELVHTSVTLTLVHNASVSFPILIGLSPEERQEAIEKRIALYAETYTEAWGDLSPDIETVNWQEVEK